jgi:hypothetical protein
MLQCNTIPYNIKTGETNHVTMQHHTIQHQDRRNKSCYNATPYKTTPRQEKQIMLQGNTIQYNIKTGETNHVTRQHHTKQHRDRRNKSCYKATPYNTTSRQEKQIMLQGNTIQYNTKTGEKSLYNTKPRPKSGIYKLHTGI